MSPHRPTGSDAAAAPPPACAVVPVAGPASRFLPAGRTVPNALFPLVDQPALQYVAVEDIAAVTLAAGPGHESVLDRFAPRPCQQALAAKGGEQARCGEPQRSDATVASAPGVVFQSGRHGTGTPSGHPYAGVQNVAGRDDTGPAGRNGLRVGAATSVPARTPAQELGTPPESQG